MEEGEKKTSQPYFCSSDTWSLFQNTSNTNHSTVAQHAELLVFHCCSFPSTTLCIHFHLHKNFPCSCSIISPLQLLLLPCIPSFQNIYPPNTLVNSLGKPELKSSIRFVQNKMWFLIKWLLIISPAPLFGDGSFPLGNNKEGVHKPCGFVSKIPYCWGHPPHCRVAGDPAREQKAGRLR